MTCTRSRMPAHNCSSPRVCPRRCACMSCLVCVDRFRWARLDVDLVGAVFRVCVILLLGVIPDPRSFPVVASYSNAFRRFSALSCLVLLSVATG